jgi:hypothetical protein
VRRFPFRFMFMGMVRVRTRLISDCIPPSSFATGTSIVGHPPHQLFPGSARAQTAQCGQALMLFRLACSGSRLAARIRNVQQF